jgi:hypothetical protein
VERAWVRGCIRSETVATLLSNNFECLPQNRGKSCILQPRKLYEPLFLRLYLRYQIKIHETENIFRKFYCEATVIFKNIFSSVPVITKINTLKPGLNIQQILNLIKYKNI